MPAGDVLVKDGRVENAFVYVKDGLGDRVFAAPAEPVTIDQRGCLYHPRVTGAVTCQEIVFLNSDPLLHNVHGTPHDSRAWNFSMGVQGSRRSIRVDKPEVAVEVRCDVHPWMRAYIGVVDHPYFAVTGRRRELHPARRAARRLRRRQLARALRDARNPGDPRCRKGAPR